MVDFYAPRISSTALRKAGKLVLEQSDTSGRTKGEILGLPMYEGRPASKVAEIAAEAHRVGWRYMFVADHGSNCSDAVVDYEKSAGGRPILRSYARSRLAKKMIEILRKFEKEQAKSEHCYYIDLLTIPALKFEIVWFKDAAKKHPIDVFYALTPTRYSEQLDEEVAERYRLARAKTEVTGTKP